MTTAEQNRAGRGERPPAPRGTIGAAVAAMLACQQENGALIASPDFETYHYCWLRDSSFAAYALDRCGEHDASARYHAWVGAALAGIGSELDTAVRQRRSGLPVDSAVLPPTRFALDGAAVADDWPNFQIDGYGTWLWALREHLARAGRGELPASLRESARRAASFLAEFALDPCYDVWEENPGGVHSSTLACVYGGLIAAADLLDDADLLARAREVQSSVQVAAAAARRYQKSSISAEVDASMIWLATPFGLVDDRDPLFLAAVREITGQLDLDGGLRRFPSDTFFGGGAWPVLTASLGWHQAVTGDIAAARQSLAWIAARIDEQGRLGEQFGGDQRQPEMYREWVQRWGHPARELLWSHAMYAVLSLELSVAPDETSSTDDRWSSGTSSPAATAVRKGAGQ
jgi:GH15 family glucan-1,4-alpha-glucosidase